MNTATDIGVRPLTYSTRELAVTVAMQRARLKGCGVYILKGPDGWEVATTPDGRVADVAAVVGATGVLWLA